MIIAIAAIGANNVIGKGNKLLWHLPDDFKRFKQLTTGHPIVMGRKTFESLPNVLSNRQHIVLTRNSNFKIDNPLVLVTHSIKSVLEISNNHPKSYVIGGGEIYNAFMPYADRIEITRVHHEFEGDSFFPKLGDAYWQLINKVDKNQDDKHAYDFSFETYIRCEKQEI